MSKIQQLILDFHYLNTMDVKHPQFEKTHLIGVDLPKDVYSSIQGHADIFACSLGNQLIVERRIMQQLIASGATHVSAGQKRVGLTYPETAYYNALVGFNTRVHAPHLTDPILVSASKNCLSIPVKQGYSRCTTVALAEDLFLTSDKGVEKALKEAGKTVCFVDGKTIKLKGQDHGFIGGCCGLDCNHTLWFYGSLNGHPFAHQIRALCEKHALSIIELLDEPLEDIGGLLFWERL